MNGLKELDSDTVRGAGYLFAWYISVIAGFDAGWQLKAILGHVHLSDALSDWVNYTLLITLLSLPLLIIYMIGGLFVISRIWATPSRTAFLWILLILVAVGAIAGFLIT